MCQGQRVAAAHKGKPSLTLRPRPGALDRLHRATPLWRLLQWLPNSNLGRPSKETEPNYLNEKNIIITKFEKQFKEMEDNVKEQSAQIKTIKEETEINLQ